MDSPPPLGMGYLLPCPFCRVSQVPRRFFGYMPPPTTPDGPVPRSCYPLAPVAGFPISWEGRRPPVRVTRPNRVRLRCGLHPVSVLRP